MTGTSLPVFGRRRNEAESAPSSIQVTDAPPSVSPAPEAFTRTPDAPVVKAATTRADIVELRALFLPRMDATAVASLHPERLLIEVERLISDLATERRVQLNGREQRNLGTGLGDDILAPVPRQ